MIKSIKTLCIAALLIASYSCKKDDDDNVSSNSQGETQIDVTNPAELIITPTVFNKLDGSDVSSKITISGSTTKAGSPPSPTGESTAPTLYDDNSSENLRVRNDHAMNIGLNGTNLDDAQGMYLKVQGSSEYFDIPVSSKKSDFKLASNNTSTSGLIRKKKTDSASNNNIDVVIEIPSSITQGTFCVSYCVYNSSNQIGNVITKCIDVQEFGSNNVAFLGTWEFAKATIINEDGVNSFSKGEAYSLSYDEEACGKKETNTINSLTLTLNSNGSFQANSDNTHSYFDQTTGGFDADSNWVSYPECSSYTSSSYNNETIGAWTYNQASQTITFIYDEGEDFYSPWFEEYKLVHSGNYFTLVIDDEVVYDFVK